MKALTMGSLFDGIGGFPLAAERHGIKPIWASEIEKFPMEVTAQRFPGMAHKGDITKLNGKELYPVDIICGGSPCQDLSVAGARAGLAGERSGLFMEQVRIVREMRAAEKERGRRGMDVRPRHMIWENVPGAFSSGNLKGEDFRIVLEEIVRTRLPGATIPRPYYGTWLSAGAIICDGVFSLAWRCLDAQYWGVAQRRKRIYLMADFLSMSAPVAVFDAHDPKDITDTAPVEAQPQHYAVWGEEEALKYAPYMILDLTPGHENLYGEPYWDIRSPWREDGWHLNTGVAPREPIRVTLSSILERHPDPKYYLSKTACLGILRRAEERGKELPEQLKVALMAQAGLIPAWVVSGGFKAYHINQRDEGIDLGGVSGALMATANMQMQTFVTGEPAPEGTPIGFDGFNGDLTGDVSSTLGVNCGMSTGRSGVITPMAFAANQRDEVRDLHDVAGALGAQPGMKQQTFISEGCLTPWDTQQKRIFLPDGVSPTLAGADGGGGRNPGGLVVEEGCLNPWDTQQKRIFMPDAISPTLSGVKGGGWNPTGLLFTGAFSAGAAPTAGGIGYQKECAPTLRAGESGTNMVPSILCLNDQGGSVMSVSEDATGTLRAQEHGHQPLVFENHGIDARYTGPHRVAPTISARAGTGGNNLPLVSGGTSIFSRQRVDVFQENDVVSTESARQHKDATDLVYQKTVGALTSSDCHGPNSQYVGQDKLVVDGPLLIRRLTPLECERLQGFPDGWTLVNCPADSARYKALGNSVAIPCVEFIMAAIVRVSMLSISYINWMVLCCLWS